MHLKGIVMTAKMITFHVPQDNQPGGGDGEKRASFRKGFWFA